MLSSSRFVLLRSKVWFWLGSPGNITTFPHQRLHRGLLIGRLLLNPMKKMQMWHIGCFSTSGFSAGLLISSQSTLVLLIYCLLSSSPVGCRESAAVGAQGGLELGVCLSVFNQIMCCCGKNQTACGLAVLQRQQAAASCFDQIRNVAVDSGLDCFTSVASCMLHRWSSVSCGALFILCWFVFWFRQTPENIFPDKINLLWPPEFLALTLSILFYYLPLCTSVCSVFQPGWRFVAEHSS